MLNTYYANKFREFVNNLYYILNIYSKIIIKFERTKMAYKVKRNNNKKSTNTKKSKTTKASKQKNTENVWQRFINYFKNIN